MRRELPEGAAALSIWLDDDLRYLWIAMYSVCRGVTRDEALMVLEREAGVA